MLVKYRDVGFTFSLLFYLAILAGGQSVFSESASFDSETIARLAQDGNTSGGSYGAMAALYLMIPDGLHILLTAAVGFCAIITYFWKAISKEEVVIIAFLSLSPSILTLGAFQKDTILAIFVLINFFVLSRDARPEFKVTCVTLVYVAYGVIFRQYYLLIATIFIFSYALFYFHRLFSLYAALIFFGGLFFVPPSVYQSLQESRDIVNNLRLSRPIWEQPRTAFLNPLPPENLVNFTFNYAFAVARLNLSIFWSLAPRDVFSFINTSIYIYFIFWSLKQYRDDALIAGLLGVSHLIVLQLFEPDSGSYLRHLGSILPYITIILRVYFDKEE